MLDQGQAKVLVGFCCVEVVFFLIELVHITEQVGKIGLLNEVESALDMLISRVYDPIQVVAI